MPVNPRDLEARRNRLLAYLAGGPASGLESMGPPPVDVTAALERAPVAPDIPTAAVMDSLRGRAPLDARVLHHLESIILPDARPTVGVTEDAYGSIGGEWMHFEATRYREALRGTFRAVGRIEAPGTGGTYLGTGFLVGPNLLLTNRHVASQFVEGLGRGPAVRLQKHLRPQVDFRQEWHDDGAGPYGTEPHPIVGVRFVHPYWDAALLEVDGDLTGRTPLTLLSAPPKLFGQELAVVGYPAYDPYIPAEVAHKVFRSCFSVKRLQPGRQVGTRSLVTDGWPTVKAMTHDASTLGGNSGSVIVYLPRASSPEAADPAFGQVIGLHFAGAYLDTNYAVPAWELARDRRVREAIGDAGFAQPLADVVAGPGEAAWEEVDKTVSVSMSRADAPEEDDAHDAHACDEAHETLGTEAVAALEDAPPGPTERSGAQWVARYLGSRSLATLREPFQANVRAFVDVLVAAGATVKISATFRPPERAYLMHWCCRIAAREVGPASVPAMAGVPIGWDHGDLTASRAAAAAMKHGYGIAYPAALRSRHTEGRAVDMTIQWTTELRLTDRAGTVHTIPPGDGATSTALHTFGRTFGVHKLVSDRPHWSEDGR